MSAVHNLFYDIDSLYYETGESIEMLESMIDSYTPASFVDLFYEEENEASANAVAVDQKAKKSIIDKVKELVVKVKDMISKVITSITTFFKTLGMSKEDKELFKTCQQIIRDNPEEFKGRTLTVKNFKQFNEEYKRIVDYINHSIDSIDNANEEKANEIVEKTKKVIATATKNLGEPVTAIVSVDLALRMAESNTDVAKMINGMLEKENGLMDKISSQIGKERAEDFKKKIKSSTHKISLHRMKVRLLGQWHRGLSSSVGRTVQDFTQILNPKMSLGANINRMKHMRVFDDILGAYNTKTNSNVTKKDIVKTVNNTRRTAKKINKAVKSDIDSANKFIDNKSDEFKKTVDDIRDYIKK